MNYIKKFLAPIVLAALALLTYDPPAQADSFSLTNVMPASTGIASYPTNAAGTNGLMQFTGRPISVKNMDNAGFSYTCWPIVNTKGITNTIVLVSSMVDTPTIVTDTNGWTTAFPWDEAPSNSAAGLTFSFTIPALQTNAFTFNTNLGTAFVRDASYIGIYAFTNGSAYVQSNITASLYKKIIPSRAAQ